MRRRIVCILATAVAVAFCFLKSYEVQPTHYPWSGWTSTNGYVAQTFIANFRSAAEVWCFVGDRGNGSSYNVDIYDYPDGSGWIARKHDVPSPAMGYVWLKFELETQTGQKFVRGKEYKVVVTRPEGQINWFRDTTNQYSYGHMEGGGGSRTPKDDLCMKLFGKARVGTEFATHSNVAWSDDPAYETIPYTPSWCWDSCIRRESELGIEYDKIGYGFWPIIQRTGNTRWVWGWLDTLMMSFATHRVRPIMSFRGTPEWATCAHSRGGQPLGCAIPINLWKPVRDGDSINDDNYYAKYIYEFVRRYGPKGSAYNGDSSGVFWWRHQSLDTLYIRLFEGFPETPYSGLHAPWRDSFTEYPGGYWRLVPDPFSSDSVSDPDYRDTIAHHIQLYGETEGLKSSLAAAYARLIIVVDSAVKLAYMPSLPGQPARCQSVAYIEDQGMYGMNDWLTRLKAYGADTCFDVASCWGYAWTGNPEGHAGVLQWVRNCLSDAGYAPRPCIFTEFGCVWEKYNPPTDVQRAFHLSKAYPVLEAANATPGYPALQGAWFTFSSQYMGGNWPIILDTTHNWQSLAPAYAYEQWGTLAKGADFEGRIPCGDSVFVLQFEDTLHKRFGLPPICWTLSLGGIC